LENAAASQCIGYDKDDASRIAVNVVMFGLQALEGSGNPMADR
jgi:hypothetical protein